MRHETHRVAALADDDVTGHDLLTAVLLDAEVLGVEPRPFLVEPVPFLCAASTEKPKRTGAEVDWGMATREAGATTAARAERPDMREVMFLGS